MLRLTRATIVIAVLLAAGAAGQSVRFTNQADQAFEAARRNEAPVFVYVTRSTAGEDEDIEDLERDHRKSFRHPVVAELLKRYVCFELSGSRYQDLLQKWQLPAQTRMMAIFVEGDGTRFGPPLTAPEIANPEQLAEALARTYRTFANKQYETTLKAIVAGDGSDVRQLQAALKRIQTGVITAADQDIIKLLENPDLPPAVRNEAFETLAVLSTQPAMEKLLELAVGGDRNAERQLARATPEGATYLFPALASEPIEQHIAAYQAIVKICDIDKPKAKGFWNNKNPDLLNAEVDRVREAATKAATRWKETYGRFR